MRLTKAQRRHLAELAAIRDNGNTGEAYFYPIGSEHATANCLCRLRLLESALGGRSVFRLTDAGYKVGKEAAEA